MITRISKQNAEKYQILFGKAAELLKEVKPSGLDSTLAQYEMTWDDFAIGSLNEYFAYLEDIKNAAMPDEDKAAFFVRLPLDEDTFKINADSRAITVPSSFSRYGLGVCGDEMAEVVYFEIDRFFDSMDLANDDVNIAIQWEAKNANKQTIIGISRNFGKDIETIPGKIIFGWPISSELTQIGGKIKFAVRFYTVGQDDNNNNIFTYSFATLPSEVTINDTLNYNLLNNSVKEIDNGQKLLNRIKNSGIYDASLGIPEEPTITRGLYAVGRENDRVVDLPSDNSGVELRIEAKPTSAGVVSYDWRKFAYDDVSGDYLPNSNSLTNNTPNYPQVRIEYVEVIEDIPTDSASQYYTKTIVNGQDVYTLVSLSTELASPSGNAYTYVEDLGFLKNDSTASYTQVYRKFGVAVVDSVGIYTVDTSAKILVNTVKKTMAQEDGIKIPGPLKPIISFNEDENVSSADNVAHIIADDGVAELVANARPGETDANAVVDIDYVWRHVVGANAPAVSAEAVPENQVKAYILGTAGHGHLPESEDFSEVYDAAANNQSGVVLQQVGDQATIYVTGELEKYLSTNEEQQDDEYGWIAIDIDTGTDDITQLTWGGSSITQSDVNEAASVGLGAGHIIFWAKAEQIVNGRTIDLGDDLSITFGLSYSMPQSATYAITEDAENYKNSLVISGLAQQNLDETYYVDVTATRNKVPTTQPSGLYRVTNSPKKPVILYKEYNRQQNKFEFVPRDYQSENNSLIITKPTAAGASMPVLSVSIDPDLKYDNLSYLWMRINASEQSDWEDAGIVKLQIDLDDMIEGLKDVIGNPAGPADFFVEGDTLAAARKYIATIPAIGEVVTDETADNGPKYPLSADDEPGYYYCIVINELNNHINANASIFFHVS